MAQCRGRLSLLSDQLKLTMKGLFKKSVRSIRKSKADNPGDGQETRVRGVDARRSLPAGTSQSTDEETVVGSEINIASKDQCKGKEERVDLGTDSTAETTTLKDRNGEVGTEANAAPKEIPFPLSGPEIAQRNLLRASRDLEEILRLYFNRDNTPTGTGQQYADIKPPLSAGKDGVDADKLANLMSAFVSRQSGQPSSTLATKVSSAFGKIYPLASIITRLGVATGDVFTPVKGAMGGLAVLLSIAEMERTRSDDFLQELQKITYQSSRIAELQKSLAASEMGDLLIERSTRLLTAIIVYFKDSIIYMRHGYFYSLGKAVVQGEKVYTDAKLQLQVAIHEYDQALLLQIAISTLSLRPRQIPADTGSKTQAELIRWLGSAYWETEAQFSSQHERRQEGTLLWLLDLDVFKRWRANGADRLWLTAPPGIGKSILAAYLVRLLKRESPEAVVLYFFCSAGNAKLNTLPKLIRTLAAQIVISAPSAMQYLQRLKDEGFESEDSSFLFTKLVQEPLRQLPKTQYIVIDGLDECTAAKADSNTFVRDLQKLGSKVVLTSRPMLNVQEQFDKCLHYRISSENVEDIQTYVSKRIAQSPILKKGFERIQKKDPEKFKSEKAQGNFLWVTTLLGHLEKNGVSAQAFQTGFDNIPDSLSQVYGQLLDRLHNAGTLKLARVVLCCVLCSMSPLTVKTLRVATTVLYEEVLNFQEFIQLECGSILTIIPREGSGTVQVVHETFKSYIMNTDLGSRALGKRICHFQLATACLECLTCENPQFEPLRDYASEHWLVHFDAYQAAKDKQLPEPEQMAKLLIKLHKFLTDDMAFGSWVKRCIFIIQDGIRMRYFCFDMKQVHDSVLSWLKSEELEQICEKALNNADQNLEVNAAVSWRQKITATESRELAIFISKNMSRTWLSTNWAKCDLSQWIFIHCMKAAKMLKVIESDDKVPERGKRVMTRADTAMNPTQLDELAKLGDFKPFIGVHAANIACGGYHASHDATARYYLSAIDEHPEWWYLYEGLGKWYYRVNRKKEAVGAFKEAMDHIPNASHLYWAAQSEVFVERGDISSALDTLCKAEALSNDEGAFKYIDQMATVYKDRKEWEKVKGVYSQALQKRSLRRDQYWLGLVEAYGECYDWRGQLRHLVSANTDDPNNSIWYCRKMIRLAEDLRQQMLYTQAVEILETAMATGNVHQNTKDGFQILLARVYMASRDWAKAIDVCTSQHTANDSLRQTMSSLIGDAYLASGDTKRAIEELEARSRELLDTVALAHMIDGEVKQAIRLLKRRITKFHSSTPKGPENPVVAGTLMEMHLDLGQCYNAVGRKEDSLEAFHGGIAVFQQFANDHTKLPDPDDAETPIYRCHARPFVIYGDLLVEVGQEEKAREYYEAAEKVMAKTRFVGDDDILDWEYEKCVKKRETALDKQSLEQKREGWAKRLELEICESYRINWYSFMASDMPRYRGGKDGWAAKLLAE